MKRSRNINLDRMRKRTLLFAPLATAVSLSLAGCGSNTEDVNLFTSVDECKQRLPSRHSDCEAAYKKAEREALRSGPKYSSRSDCEAEFGRNSCESHPDSSPHYSVFTPAMTGFMLGRAMREATPRSAALYSSSVYNSPLRGNWVTSDARIIAKRYNKTASVNKTSFGHKPSTVRTLHRGGFGSIAVAKSQWGSRSSSYSGGRGWGG